jgi:hypothetical protein
MEKPFRRWEPEQRWLLPPAVEEFVPAGHLAHFVRELVREQLDLTAILRTALRVLPGRVRVAPDRPGL